MKEARREVCFIQRADVGPEPHKGRRVGFTQKKTEREKEKRITTLGLLISYEGKRQDIGSAKPQRGAFRIFFMIMINKRGKSGGR